MMNDCPLVRSLEQIMSSGKPFVWMPGELPFLPIPVMMYRSLQMGANFIMPKGLKILCPSLEKTLRAAVSKALAGEAESPVPTPPPAEQAEENDGDRFVDKGQGGEV